MTYHLTRAVLDKNAPEHALRPLLDPPDEGKTLDAHHRLMWTLFPDRDAKRDFLWRADGNGKFLILSARPPRHSPLFNPIDSKTFTPRLSAGDRLAFIVRTNATKDRRPGPQDKASSDAGGQPRTNRRVDIVMHAMQKRGLRGGVSSVNSRAARRMDVASEVAQDWFTVQGQRRGFLVNALSVEDYRVCKVRRRGRKEATFGVLDVRGVLTVRDPEVFTTALCAGLGRAKAYGCGLMLVRRV